MNWIDNIYAMTFATSAMLGVIHLFIWFRQRQLLGHLLFFVAAVSVALLAMFEMTMLHATTPQQYATLLRWSHVPITTFILSSLWFVHRDIGTGRLWLMMAAAGLRVVAFAANFLSGDNLQYLELVELGRVDTLFGQTVPVPAGAPNPWMTIGQLSNFLIVCYLVDAIISAWRSKHEPRSGRAIFICGSYCVSIIISSLWAIAVVLGKLDSPFLLSPTFLPIALIMSYLLGSDIVDTIQLSRDLQHSQDKLRESEQRMEQTTTAANIGLWTWDVDNEDSWFSDIGAKLLGVPPDAKLTRDEFLDRVHADDRVAIQDARTEALTGSGKYWVEYRMQQADGRYRWFSARGRAERDGPDSPLYLRGVLVDITERRQAEDRVKLVVDASPVGKLVCNSSGTITLANPSAEQMFGYTRGELLGQSVDILLPHSLRETHAELRSGFLEEPLARAMGEGRDLFGLRKDGSAMAVEIGITPMELDNTLQLLVSITDISERKRMEQESAMQREELAHLSRVTLLGELSGSLAHELNQPLTAVLSNAQAALRFLDHDPPNLGEVRDGLLHIVENDKRASEVIRRLRAMLRKEKIDYQQLDINEVIQDVLRLINSDVLNRGITLKMHLSPRLPPLIADRVQLQQVILNLVINACDAMRGIERERILTVRTSKSPECGVSVTISDVGHGIPSEDLERIFSPFVTTKPEGIGLGLAICRSIIQSHHGKLWATSSQGKGSTLHFTLPLDQDPPALGRA